MATRTALTIVALFLHRQFTWASTLCCQELGQAFPNETVFPSLSTANSTDVGSLFEELNTVRFSNTAVLSPSCIFRPSSVEHVSQGLKILTVGACKFAIKSGGHMAVPGANNIDNGVSVDLSWLNSTRLSDDRTVVHLGAGGTWGSAYETFEADGIGFPGGVCGTTGVGGVSLGGGESYFQPSKGWVVDNVVNFEVVLASGDVVNANQTSNSDLFKALKGGSSNFGIVTQVDVAAFDFDSLWAGQIIVPALNETVQEVLAGLTDFTAKNNIDTASGIQVVVTYFNNGSNIVDLAVGNVDGIVNPDSLSPFTSMQPQITNTASVRTLANWVQEVDEVQPAGFRDLSATITFVNDLETIRLVHAVTNKIYDSVKFVPDMDWIFFYVPQPKIIQDYSTQRGGNVLGLAENPQDEIVTFIVPRWTDSAYDAVMYAAAQKWSDEVQNVTRNLGTYSSFSYINFAGKFQKPLCGYGPDNVAFMRQVAQKYDPDQVFQTLVPGGFKISQAC